MEENDLKELAAQLRQPNGDAGKHIAQLMNEGNRILNEWLIEELPLQPEARILEIGMGNGKFIPELFKKESGIFYVGSDFSETMISESTENNPGFVRDGRVKFCHAPAHNMPFDNCTFDAIFTANTIYFYDDPEKELSEFHRVLKPNGTVLIGIRPKAVMQHYPFVQYGFNLFDPEEIGELLMENGFTVQYIKEKEEPPQEHIGMDLKISSAIICGRKH